MNAAAREHAVLVRACLTRAVRELQEATARSVQGMECDDDVVLPQAWSRTAERSALDALDQVNQELARDVPVVDTKAIAREPGKPDRRKT